MAIEFLRKDKIYADYYEKVSRYVAGKIGNYSDREDIVSDVFLKVYAKLDTFDPSKSSISTWIYYITQNTVTDYYRSRRVFGEIPETLADEANLEENAVNEEMLESLADSLEKLDDRSRKLIILHYNNGMLLKDIAGKLGISYVYAKVLHKKALETLKEYLD